jgi:hypothetical protein
MEKYNSNYLGIVIQNNDPEHRGRVKVWVPHISANIYDKWNNLKKDQTFSFPGTPHGENLSAILPELRKILPWAEYAAPIVGGSTAGYYNAPTDTHQVSDAHLFYGQPGSNTTSTSSATNIDPEGKGGKPGALFESNPVSDNFGNTAKVGSLNVNPNSNDYKPSTYSNAAKGLFSIPNVGAHVWVFFRDGMPQYPVYFGASFGQDDFDSIFKAGDGSYPDYPGTYENIKATTTDSSIYRNKMVLNQRGATIEIINTTDRESYKVTHYNGAYYEMNKDYTAIFNPKKIQILTLGDKFETINGHNNVCYGRSYDHIVRGDNYQKIGNFNIGATAAWNSLYQQLASGADEATIATTLQSLSADMTVQEKQMGEGGNSFEFVTKHKVITVGLVQNTANAYSASINPLDFFNLVTSVSPNLITGYYQPITKLVAPFKKLFVPDMPGGNLDIFATSRFKVQTGAGGIAMRTTGNIDITGGLVSVAGAQVTVGSKDGQVALNGSVVQIGGDAVVLKSNIGGQVVVDSTLGVSKNVIIGGGAYVEGELFVNHITAPVEYQVTENTQIIAKGPPVNINGTPGVEASGWAIEGGLATGSLVVTCVAGNLNSTGSTATLSINIGSLLNVIGGVLNIAQPHSHVFKNIPLSLLSQKPGPNDFNKYAADTLKDDKAAGSSPRFDGRISTVGIPGPGEGVGLYDVIGTSFTIIDSNTPNGPGSDVAGPVKLPI